MKFGQESGPRESHAKFLIRSCGCNGGWAADRGRLAGYETDGRCVCGQVDTHSTTGSTPVPGLM
eukprot:3984211-Pyramimonas_sp.AAC.1